MKVTDLSKCVSNDHRYTLLPHVGNHSAQEIVSPLMMTQNMHQIALFLKTVVRNVRHHVFVRAEVYIRDVTIYIYRGVRRHVRALHVRTSTRRLSYISLIMLKVSNCLVKQPDTVAS